MSVTDLKDYRLRRQLKHRPCLTILLEELAYQNEQRAAEEKKVTESDADSSRKSGPDPELSR